MTYCGVARGTKAVEVYTWALNLVHPAPPAAPPLHTDRSQKLLQTGSYGHTRDQPAEFEFDHDQEACFGSFKKVMHIVSIDDDNHATNRTGHRPSVDVVCSPR